MKKLIAILLCITLLFLVSCGKEETQPAPTGTPTGVIHVVNMTNDEFIPSTLTIDKGDTVHFVNVGTNVMWPASGGGEETAVHDQYPGSHVSKCATARQHEVFDACTGIFTKTNFSFTFYAVGSWNYHNHLKPMVIGVINVVES